MKPRIVEDMALMNAITRQTPYRLGWAVGKKGVAVSAPESKFSTFVEQRRRWLNEVGDMPFIGKFMLGYGAFMHFNFFAALFLIPYSVLPIVVVSVAWYGGFVIVFSKNPGATIRDMTFIPFLVIFQIMYCTTIVYRSLFHGKKVKWKGRDYH